MNLLAALWLQANDLGSKQQPYTPGSEGPFSKIMIGVFLIGMVIAIGIGIHMVVQGCRGALRKKVKKL